ncbi:hypothetical protein Agabi119p4_1193 [Agaricus bisporus var. burnettii]|uniref:CxC1-like cysteine cluster associated with KDZ transposases domain-containing protein n=1 Tax=Agaricus bisporus var. burnettii TaxID=192524 RepID=A0A8H7FCQ1_AGABI|nr:hypothetical protein Agabi119p4_1193 [Agaricus bisporus var. burnettii]
MLPKPPRKQRTTASSNRAAHVTTVRTPFGNSSQVKQYDAKALREEYDQEMYKARQRRVVLDERMKEETARFRRLSGTGDSDATYGDNDIAPTFPLEPEDVLSGNVPLSISHAGGELLSILLDEGSGQNQSYAEWRTRRDHVENRNKAFKLQLPFIVQAYLEWDVSLGEAGLEGASPRFTQSQQGIRLRVMDMFRTRVEQTDIVDGPEGVPASFVRHGLFPCAPIRPTLAVSTRLLEFYHNTHLRCPHLSMQSFVQGLCDTHKIEFHPYLSTQFSICYDLFLQVRNTIASKVQQYLGRDSPDWRLKNACPACTYRLKEEDSMVYTMLVTMDGNDSLKRVIRKNVYENPDNEDGEATTVVTETLDTRRVVGDYYLDRETVDRWARDRVMEAICDGGVDADNPCAARWTNMANEITARMWGVFDETGIFLALCRHGFVLLVADMVRSGELAKYPLAVVDKLLAAFGAGLGVGYDIGCRFGATLARSGLGDQVREMRLKTLVGAFHGHAHNRLCQLSNLATYVEGLGLEDLEGCERFFSKSNALASSVRYASVFHRRQHVEEYIKHLDVTETSQNLSEFLVNNYKQALQIIAGEKDLYDAMRRAGITDAGVFHGWLKEEREYLRGRSKEPEVETLHIDYYRALVKLNSLEEDIRMQQSTFIAYQPPGTSRDTANPGKRPRQNQTHGLRLMHAREQFGKALDKVQDLERILEILPGERWIPGSTQWDRAAMLFTHKHYQRCLDELESLVVSRLFELTKMNMSQTGYKLRKHIGNALRQRSQAIRNAIDRYNSAAAELNPPREKLTWDKVVDYAFLTDFSLLRDCREDITQRPWARPHSRVLMDQYFKIIRAREEIKRVNIEIRRVITYLHDEDCYLRLMEEKAYQSDSLIAHQIRHLRLKTMRFKDLHMRRFLKLAGSPNFSGSVIPGQSLDRTRHIDRGIDHDGSDINIPTSTFDVQGLDEQDISEEDLEESEARQLQEIDQRYSLLSTIVNMESASAMK